MIKTDINVNIGYNTEDIKSEISKSLGFPSSEILSFEILKKELKLDGLSQVYKLSVAFSVSDERRVGLLKMRKRVSPYEFAPLNITPTAKPTYPVVAGAGPAGLFSALVLAEAGECPIILERGERIDLRQRSVGKFFKTGEFSKSSNAQFGEGGAGAFSDGKLKFGARDKYNYKVLCELVRAGADEDILYTKGAHLGTDKLPLLVTKIRERIISLGGKFIFGARLTDLIIKDGALSACIFEREGRTERIDTERLLLAIGHSARDTFSMLYDKQIPMQQRPFGIGVRIEHPREYINKLIYKDASLASSLGTASYHLVSHLPSGRSVYSFCMCPGGVVVPAAGSVGGVVTNGMSEYSRMADNSNAAHLVSLTPGDFKSDHPLAGFEIQRKIEECAFRICGEDYTAPAIRMDDFLSNRPAVSDFTEVKPSYSIGVRKRTPDDYLPNFVTDSLREGILEFDKWLSGFNLPTAVLTGPETRSTSPVRILREEISRECPTVKGLYPIGEGAGYSGGIVSSAADGVRTAAAILKLD